MYQHVLSIKRKQIFSCELGHSYPISVTLTHFRTYAQANSNEGQFLNISLPEQEQRGSWKYWI